MNNPSAAPGPASTRACTCGISRRPAAARGPTSVPRSALDFQLDGVAADLHAAAGPARVIADADLVASSAEPRRSTPWPRRSRWWPGWSTGWTCPRPGRRRTGRGPVPGRAARPWSVSAAGSQGNPSRTGSPGHRSGPGCGGGRGRPPTDLGRLAAPAAAGHRGPWPLAPEVAARADDHAGEPPVSRREPAARTTGPGFRLWPAWASRTCGRWRPRRTWRSSCPAGHRGGLGVEDAGELRPAMESRARPGFGPAGPCSARTGRCRLLSGRLRTRLSAGESPVGGRAVQRRSAQRSGGTARHGTGPVAPPHPRGPGCAAPVGTTDGPVTAARLRTAPRPATCTPRPPTRNAAGAVDPAWAGGIRYFDTAPHYGLGLSEQPAGPRRCGTTALGGFVLSTKVGRLLEPNPRPGGLGPGRGRVRGAGPLRRRSTTPRPGSGAAWRTAWSGSGWTGSTSCSCTTRTTTWTRPSRGRSRADPAARRGRGRRDRSRDEPVAGTAADGPREPTRPRHAGGPVDPAGRSRAAAARGECAATGGGRGGGRAVQLGAAGPGLAAAGRPSTTGPPPAGCWPGPGRWPRICARYGVSLPDAAIQFPLRHPAVVSVVTGMRNAEQVTSALSGFATVVPDDAWTELDAC